MIISDADFKSDPEKYLGLCGEEEIIITRDGKKFARLTAPPAETEVKEAISERGCA